MKTMIGFACDYCQQSIEPIDDGFEVTSGHDYARYHYVCGEKIQEAMVKARAERPSESNGATVWQHRETQERIAALEDSVSKVKSVWRLWLKDAQRGSISPTTFDLMKKLLGMD